ncbi:hypothetical protein [Nocardia sp. NPDC051981]|uniref:hypothetical protein n=1 Tax=Nocardia sp. NPDC051981 TaxID=3155417 RepID=UPI0034147CDD
MTDLMGSAVHELLAQVLARYGSIDVFIALITAEIRDTEQRRIEAVTRARAAGASGEAIAQAANITRQSAHERWSKITR